MPYLARGLLSIQLHMILTWPLLLLSILGRVPDSLNAHPGVMFEYQELNEWHQFDVERMQSLYTVDYQQPNGTAGGVYLTQHDAPAPHFYTLDGAWCRLDHPDSFRMRRHGHWVECRISRIIVTP